MHKKIDFYNGLIEKADKKILTLNKNISILSWSRLLVFVAGFVVSYLLLNISITAFVLSLTLSLIIFVALVVFHTKKLSSRKYYKSYIKTLKIEIEYLEGDWTNLDNAKDLNNHHHSFSKDLDVFGDYSLYKICSRCISEAGRQRLADFLKNPLAKQKDIKATQEAVSEMAEKTTFRLDFISKAKLVKDAKNKTLVQQWLNEDKDKLVNKLNNIIRYALPAITIAVLTLVIFKVLSFNFFIVLFFVNIILVGRFAKKSNKKHQNLSEIYANLEKYIILIDLISNENFKSDILKERYAVLNSEKVGAKKELSDLKSILKLYDNRLNIIVTILLNSIILWDFHLLFSLENWKKKNAKYYSIWESAIADFDAFVSMGTLAFNHEDWNMPTFSDTDYLVAEDAKHPLVNTNKCIANDINMHSKGSFIIVTGANMAGKSTYLRMIGLNLVLAMSGLPVPAKKFAFKPLPIVTSIRNDDDLSNDESYFYSELKSLKVIIDKLNNGSAYVLLDEVLRGTNSKDKRAGSMALVKQLCSLGAIGIIATHDLVLAELRDELGSENITNKCFEVDIEDDNLIFDYKLRDGVSENMNATFLMKKMGITL